MTGDRRTPPRRAAIIVAVATTTVALLATAAGALLVRLTRIPLGRGTATITWTGAAGTGPTIQSIKGAARGYSVSATGRIPKAPLPTGSSSIPSQFPLADIKGTIGGTPFSLDIVLTLPASLTSDKKQTFGHATGTFRNQAVEATLTANINSDAFAFKGTIGTLRVSGVVSPPHRHGNTATARATFDVTK
jgi:hypothetical protein